MATRATPSDSQYPKAEYSLSPLLTLGAYALYEFPRAVYREFNSPLRYLPGPKSSYFFYGNESENVELKAQWVQQYGSTYNYESFFGATRLLTTDTKAVDHFLVNNDIYQKPEAEQYTLGRIGGPGLLVAEGDEHRQQNPAFGIPQMRELTGIFVEKSIQAVDAGGGARVNIAPWLNKATLDIIGLAGFKTTISSPSSGNAESAELGKAISTIFEAGMKPNALRTLQALVPPFRLIVCTSRCMPRKCCYFPKRQLLQESKNEMAENGGSRDLFSLLVRANTAKDIPVNQRLSDEDVLAQVPTFLVAGHETMATAMIRALFALTQNVAAQMRLQEELFAAPTDHPTMDGLNELQYLDCVVRETLRLHAPVPAYVPLATPFTDINGSVHETLSAVLSTIPIVTINRDKATWGKPTTDSPDRWESQAISNSIPGVWSHMLPGYRFSLVAMKALLFPLVRAFEFELAVPVADIGKQSSNATVQHPRCRDPDAVHHICS
ncbi:cytochrome P450 [Mycena maculata]|uniref:Cytochrome P450 n=1 Tax=Mycena maculata TaxID=230809 RepID=A0AAD7JKJ9_9AGAR|nr:cytochrome P450 [Mycena maculata]